MAVCRFGLVTLILNSDTANKAPHDTFSAAAGFAFERMHAPSMHCCSNAGMHDLQSPCLLRKVVLLCWDAQMFCLSQCS